MFVLGMILYSPGVMNLAYKLRLSLPEPASPEARGLSEIYYCLHDDGSYPDGLTKEKRAVHKRAAILEIEMGEVFFVEERKEDQTVKEQKQILQACHSDPTSGHYGAVSSSG